MADITVDVLGPTQIGREGNGIALRPRERDVLAALALKHPQPVSVMELAELLWVTPPASDTKTLQNHVARIRGVLGADAVVTVGSSYALGPAVAADLTRFAEARSAATRAASVGDHRGAALRLQQAVALVRGEPFADLEATRGVAEARRHWAAAVTDAQDAQLLSLLQSGDLAAALVTAERLHIGVRERRAVLIGLTYYRGGRRLDALRALHGCRQALRTAGLLPGDLLLRFERSLLIDDPGLMVDDVTGFVDHSSTTLAAPGAPVLVGRDRELKVLQALLDERFDAVASAPAVVVAGPAGIGKSALCARVMLQARLSGWSVVESARLAAADVLLAIQMATERPLLVVMEEANRYSPGDWSTIAGGCGARTLVLATSTAAPTGGDVRVLSLSPLDRDEVRQLVAATIGAGDDTVSAEFVDAVTVGSGGVPALVVELAIEGGEVADGFGLVDRLVQGLSAEALALARMAALATAPVTPATLLAATARAGLQAGDTALGECVARRVLLADADDRVICRDDDVRAALVGALPAADVLAARRAWIGQHLADGDAPLAVADHVAGLPDWPAADAVAIFDAATKAATSAARYELALANARRALQMATRISGPDDREVLRREIDITGLMRLTVDMSYYDRQWELVDRLTALGDADNLLHLIGLMCSMGASSEAGALDLRLAELVDRAFELPADTATRAAAAARATNFFALADGARARRVANIALDESARLDDEVMRLFCIQCADLGLGHPDDWPRRVALGRESAALAERMDDDIDRASSMQLVFAGQVQFADPLCRATMDRLSAIARRLDLPLLNWIDGYLRGALLHIEGRLEECEALITEIRSYVPLPQSRLDAVYYGQLVAVRVAQGRIEEMVEPVERLAREQPLFGLWRGFRAWTTAAVDPAAARRQLDELDGGAGFPPDLSWAATMYSLGRATALAGDVVRCSALLPRLLPYTEHMAWMGHGIVGPMDLALAELYLALGQPDAAAGHLATAQRLVRQLHAPVFEAELASLRARLA